MHRLQKKNLYWVQVATCPGRLSTMPLLQRGDEEARMSADLRLRLVQDLERVVASYMGLVSPSEIVGILEFIKLQYYDTWRLYQNPTEGEDDNRPELI
jgi:hypothetical protein